MSKTNTGVSLHLRKAVSHISKNMAHQHYERQAFVVFVTLFREAFIIDSGDIDLAARPRAVASQYAAFHPNCKCCRYQRRKHEEKCDGLAEKLQEASELETLNGASTDAKFVVASVLEAIAAQTMTPVVQVERRRKRDTVSTEARLDLVASRVSEFIGTCHAITMSFEKARYSHLATATPQSFASSSVTDIFARQFRPPRGVVEEEAEEEEEEEEVLAHPCAPDARNDAVAAASRDLTRLQEERRLLEIKLADTEQLCALKVKDRDQRIATLEAQLAGATKAGATSRRGRGSPKWCPMHLGTIGVGAQCCTACKNTTYEAFVNVASEEGVQRLRKLGECKCVYANLTKAECQLPPQEFWTAFKRIKKRQGVNFRQSDYCRLHRREVLNDDATSGGDATSGDDAAEPPPKKPCPRRRKSGASS